MRNRVVAAAAALSALLSTGLIGSDQRSDDPPAGHGMLVVGEGSVFLSHLPIFGSPHDYQVILAATFVGKGEDPQRAYQEDRRKHPEARVYTIDPKAFVLPELFPAFSGEAPRRKSFRADIYRGHFERFPSAQAKAQARIARDAEVQVTAVIHARRFSSGAKRAPQLRYLLFGTPTEMFLCHLIAGPPDFDQVLAVKVTGRAFTEEELRAGIPVSFAGRADSIADRIKPAEKALAGVLELSGGAVSVQIEPGLELYFEQDELAG
jgi:hypothetical protein